MIANQTTMQTTEVLKESRITLPVVEKAVVLCGGAHMEHWMFLDGNHPAILPILGRPLLHHILQTLAGTGVKEIAFVSDNDRILDFCATSIPKQNELKLFHEPDTRGTAGCLKALEEKLSPKRFFVVRGDVFLSQEELNALIKKHTAARSIATVCLDGSGHPIGLYLFEALVLKHIDKRFMDIDSHLIASLLSQNLNVVYHRFASEQPTPISLSRPQHLLDTERFLLGNGHFSANTAFSGLKHLTQQQGMHARAPGIWVAEDAQISPSAQLKGPVIIGSQTIIEDKAKVLGPAVIGKGCRVGKGAGVRESSLWDGAYVAQGARVAGSMVTFNARVPRGKTVERNVVLKQGFSAGLVSLIDDCASRQKRVLSLFLTTREKLRVWLFRILKRFVDIMAALAGIVCCFPLFVIIAAAIKLDSRGPILFRQLRCGKGGREFRMFKFRTMHDRSEELQDSLLHLNEVEGPVFKIENDPRTTKIGRFLRRTSLDELPQLANIFRGEMSLVGPRPLAAKEMDGCSLWKNARTSVRPGLTGLWQINARHSPAFIEWIKHDLFYVKYQSFSLDTRILWRTLRQFVGSLLQLVPPIRARYFSFRLRYER
jgi:lipopolysaccharide/colanic/teichoic acid biosynthesis glycosyltransferase/NDP-sugar pyrophosphorylase family protein